MTSSQTHTAEAGPAHGRTSRAKVAGLGVCLVVAAVYTIEAFRLRTPANSIGLGPDFFPQWIGIILTLLLVTAIVSCFVRREPDSQDEDEDPVAALIFIVISVAGVVLFLTIPWFVALAVYMMATLSYLNRGRHGWNIVLSIAIPGLLYLVFATGLDATLPEW